MKMKFYLIISILLLSVISCTNRSATGIEGNDNDNNTIIITDKVEMPDEDSKKYKPNYSITSEGVGGIKIGQSIQEVQQFYTESTSFKFKTYEGARGKGTDFDYPTIYVLDEKGEYLLSLRSDNLTKINAIEVLSSKYKTYNGIHVGMKVSELSAIYHDDLILDIDFLNEVEMFSPFDLNGTETSTILYIESDNGETLLKDNYEYGEEVNYNKNGRILSILVSEDGQ